MNVTQNEIAVMTAIYNSEYNSGDPLAPVWINCIWGWSGTKAFSGVCSSLSKKGFIGSDVETIWLTAEGLAALPDSVTNVSPSEGFRNARAMRKAKKEAKASAIETETKTSKAIAILHHDPKPETVTEPEAYIGLKTIAASPWQQLAIEIALEALAAKAGSLDAESADALLDMVRNSYRIEFVLKA